MRLKGIGLGHVQAKFVANVFRALANLERNSRFAKASNHR